MAKIVGRRKNKLCLVENDVPRSATSLAFTSALSMYEIFLDEKCGSQNFHKKQKVKAVIVLKFDAFNLFDLGKTFCWKFPSKKFDKIELFVKFY